MSLLATAGVLAWIGCLWRLARPRPGDLGHSPRDTRRYRVGLAVFVTCAAAVVVGYLLG